jgi:flavodoxin I
MFVGLPIDEDNEYDMTEERLKRWVEKLKEEFV